MIAEAMVLAGAVLILLAAVGVVRFDDVLTRMHALTKASTLGLLLVLIGAAIYLRDPNDYTSLALAAGLQLLTSPVSAHLISHAVYRAEGIDHRVDVVDELAEVDGDRAAAPAAMCVLATLLLPGTGRMGEAAGRAGSPRPAPAVAACRWPAGAGRAGRRLGPSGGAGHRRGARWPPDRGVGRAASRPLRARPATSARAPSASPGCGVAMKIDE